MKSGTLADMYVWDSHPINKPFTRQYPRYAQREASL